MKLAEIQTQFQNYLLSKATNIDKAIVDDVRVSANRRLQIYYQAYRLRLVDALADTYEIVHTYLGDEQFYDIANQYVAKNPSEFRSIRYYGDQFSAFIASHEDYQAHPYVAELAEFEWKLTEVFDSADAQPLRLEHLQQISPQLWPQLIFTVQPHVRRVNCSWNTAEIYNALNNQQTPPQPAQHPYPQSWLLWRSDYVSEFSSLSVEAAWMMDQIIAATDFSAICEGLSEWMDQEQVALHAASLLKGWVLAGLIRDAKIKGE